MLMTVVSAVAPLTPSTSKAAYHQFNPTCAKRERCAVPRKQRVFDNRRPILSVIVPCYNEVEVLPHTHARLSRVLSALADFECEQIYVDDGSTDGTWDAIDSIVRQSTSARALRLSRNFGHQSACLAGLRESSGDAVVVIDADLQDPPELIADMAALWRNGWSVVSAQRRSREGETLFKKTSAYLFYRLLNALSDHPLALDTGDFRLLDCELVALLSESPDKNLYLRGAVSWFGFSETSVPYDRDPRRAGESKYTLRKMLGLSRHGLLADSSVPLRLPTYMGTVVLAGGLAAAVRRRDVRLLAKPGAFGAQALALGILGEYLHAVFRQVQGRPHYAVEQRIGTVTSAPRLEERVAL
jgi:dolichol-phosphate mannosyltransferase